MKDGKVRRKIQAQSRSFVFSLLLDAYFLLVIHPLNPPPPPPSNHSIHTYVLSTTSILFPPSVLQYSPFISTSSIPSPPTSPFNHPFHLKSQTPKYIINQSIPPTIIPSQRQSSRPSYDICIF
ncbi:hypothetical protein EYC80_009076 [Monilinia laxa]|uniref:Uncharacterized protein n=1 Tax=Monilinia laxa TaxID=61186 RepID=A0A5N6K2B5_MONLA|nr:hypothetical protein EYC80_009076 [Monilinia laxa]